MSAAGKNKFLSNWFGKFDGPFIIAGPCSAESEEQINKTAELISKNESVKVFRAGLWKPRTKPGVFEGVGEEGLQWLKKAKQKYKIKICTEVAKADHVEKCLKNEIDVIWVGARTTASPFAVQEIVDAIKGTDIPIMIKNPINAELSLWEGAFERFLKAGSSKLIAVHRGFSGVENNIYRNLPMWELPIQLRSNYPDLPIICDPSHIAGKSELIQEVANKAIDLDMDGLMIETHYDPKIALSDSRQQITPEQLNLLVKNLTDKREHSGSKSFEITLEGLRAKIDQLDNELIQILSNRFEIVQKIGKEKQRNDVTPLQSARLASMMKDRLEMARKLKLSPNFIEEIFNCIHKESVSMQSELKKNGK